MTQTERTVQKKTQGRVVSLSMPRKPRGPPRALDVLDGRLDDHAEGEGDDGEVIAPGLERREGDEEARDQRPRRPPASHGDGKEPGGPQRPGKTCTEMTEAT